MNRQSTSYEVVYTLCFELDVKSLQSASHNNKWSSGIHILNQSPGLEIVYDKPDSKPY